VSAMISPRWTLTLVAMLGLFASRPVAQAAEAVEALQRRVMALAAQLGDPDPARRGAAGIDLLAITDRRAVPFLLAAIKAAPAEQRLPLVRALRRFKVSAKIAPFIAISREADWSTPDNPFGRELREQLQALGTRAFAPLFAAVTRCDPPAIWVEGPDYQTWSASLWAASTAGSLGLSVLPRIVREVSAPSRCRRWAAVQALDSFTHYENAPWTEPALEQACAALDRASRDDAPAVSTQAEQILSQRREDGVCEEPPSPSTDGSSPGLDDESRRRVFEQALASTDPAIRRGAIEQLLGSSGDDHAEADFATPLIAPLVSDADEAIRLEAVKALHGLNARQTDRRDERRRDPDHSMPALLTALRDANATVRIAAVDALAEVSPEGESQWHVSKALLSLVEASNDEEYNKLLTALATLGDPEIAPQLLAWLVDEDVNLRFVAATVLRPCGSMEMAPRLVPLLTDGDADIRRAAALTISALVSRYSQPPTPAVLAALVEPMLTALNEDDPAIRGSAIEVLGMTGDRRAVEPLIRVLPLTVNEYRCWACPVLGRLGDPRAIDAMLPYLTQGSMDLRKNVAWALSFLRDDRVVEPLKGLLRDPEAQVRHAAVETLAALGRPGAIDAVRSVALSSPEARMREAAVKELRKFPGPETDATLVRALKDPEVSVRRAAGWVLQDIARPESVPALIDALTDEDSEVRRRVAEALGKLGDRRAIDPLLRVLPHTLPEAATALEKLKKGVD
jgi:HEAT repeat protein